MALKRKRSSPSFSSPAFSDASTTSTDTAAIPFFYQQAKPVEPLYNKPTWAFPTYDDSPSAQHLNSRTRKRHRDDRPDEEAVYASTISRLYEAQRRHPDASPMPSSQSLQPTVNAHHPAQKSTLHSFWRLPSAPFGAQPMQLDVGSSSEASLELKCEDCDRASWHQDAMDLGDGALEQDAACNMCRRHVCDTCAVLGNARICLACASGR